MLTGVLARGADDNTKLQRLELDNEQLGKFTAAFGGIRRMSSSDKVRTFNFNYIPPKADASHNVPQAAVAKVGYGKCTAWRQQLTQSTDPASSFSITRSHMPTLKSWGMKQHFKGSCSFQTPSAACDHQQSLSQ